MPESSGIQAGSTRIVFINRFFHPDTSATAHILSRVAFHLASAGHDIHVIASRSGYCDQLSLSASETTGGVTIHRIDTPSFPEGLAGRALQYAAFHVGATIKIARLARKGDVIVAKTDPPLLCVPVGWIARRRKALMVNWLQDLYPETAFALGFGSATGISGRTLLAIRNAALKGSDACVTIGERMTERLGHIGVSNHATHLIANFCDDQAIYPLPYGNSRLRTEHGIPPEKFVVGYSGNLGRAHDLETMLQAIIALRDRSDILFLFTGGGHLRQILARRQQELGLTTIICLPYQPIERLCDTLGAADIHWLSLREELEGCIVPSKLYAAAAAGRGVLAIGDTNGEVARIVPNHHFGHAIAIGDSQNLANRIASLADDRKQCAALGAAARQYVDSHASQSHALTRWDQLIASLNHRS